MSSLNEDDVRQLKLFGWFLLIVNACIAGVGLLFGRALEDRSGALTLVAIVAVLVNGAFLLIVGGNLVAVLLKGSGRRR